MGKEKFLRQNAEECARYLKSIEGMEEISADEWKVLGDRLSTDNRQVRDRARERLIEGCLPMVARMARAFDPFESRGVKRIDLIGAGNLKLMEVVNVVIDNPSVLSEGYMVKSIRNALVDALCEYLGYHRHSGNNNPDGAMLSLLSFERRLNDDTESTWADVIADETEADNEWAHASAREELKRLFFELLPGLEGDILCAMYLSDHTLTQKEIARLWEIPERSVRSRHANAIARMRRSNQLGRIRELLCECVGNDGWKNTSDACAACIESSGE